MAAQSYTDELRRRMHKLAVDAWLVSIELQERALALEMLAKVHPAPVKTSAAPSTSAETT